MYPLLSAIKGARSFVSPCRAASRSGLLIPSHCSRRFDFCTRTITSDTKNTRMSNGDIFIGTEDRYNGVTVESQKEGCQIANFPQKLEESLNSWLATGKRGIWFKVHLKDAEWVPTLAKNGFDFHHAKEGFVMMYKWLPEEICNVPPYSHTNLGVGAVVINESNQVLVVSEKYFHVPHWKLPGGYVERGEDIVDAAIREVKEETGIDTEFYSVISFRHAHNTLFGNSDIYMVVQLNPLSHAIQRCERELVGCQWMDVPQFLDHPQVHTLNRSLVQKAIEYKSRGIKFRAYKDIFKMITMTKEFTIFSLEEL